jgi:DNA-binding NtrC family response regulator
LVEIFFAATFPLFPTNKRPMPTKGQTAASLWRLLERAPQALYVVDEERRLTLMSHSCESLLGITAEELMGRECRYHSATPELESPTEQPHVELLGRLCPPPQAFCGEACQGTILAVREASEPQPLWARFEPLGTAEDPAGVLVWLSAAVVGTAQPSSRSQRLHEQLQQLSLELRWRYRPESLVGTSAVARRMRTQVQLALESDVPVSVYGPRGSGTLHIAQTLHYGRAGSEARVLHRLECGLLDVELIEATLETLVTRAGAPRGEPRATLILADVEQLPREVQRHLGKLLSTDRIGARVIATARERLADLAARGELDSTLAIGMSALEIPLLALSQRREDLPLLVQAFLERLNSLQTKQLSGFTPEALERLSGYGWPGNLDELMETLAEIHARVEGPYVTMRDLPRHVQLALDPAVARRGDEEPIVLDQLLADVEREMIERALRRARGNKAKAARWLGLTRPRLYRRMLQLGLEQADEIPFEEIE